MNEEDHKSQTDNISESMKEKLKEEGKEFYYDIKKQQQYYINSHNFSKKQNEAKVALHPGEINNNHILVPITEFYNDGDVTNPENIVIRNDIDQRNDYRLVNEEMWNFFHSRYGGGPKIIRNAIEEKTKYNYSKKIIEVFYRKVSLSCKFISSISFF